MAKRPGPRRSPACRCSSHSSATTGPSCRPGPFAFESSSVESSKTESPRKEHAMLVLSRKKNESIVLNNDIVVTIIEIRGDKVRLGIVCPKDVPVHRQEVFEAIYGTPFAEPASGLESEIASLTKRIEQGDSSPDLAKLLAAKRIQLASQRSDGTDFVG